MGENLNICTPPRTLYVSDLDGTLLNSDSVISEESSHIINHLINRRDAQFTVATARTPATVVPLLGNLDVRLPYIVMAGAAMWDNVKSDYRFTNPIPQPTVESVCAVCERSGIHPFVYRRHGNVLRVHHYGELSASEAEFVAERRNSPFKEFILDDHDYTTSDDEALLIFSMHGFDHLERIYAQIRREVACSPICYHDIFGPETGIMEIYSCGTSKANAIKRLAAEIGAERIVVFGDNLNDIPMMQIADYSVATANAVDAVREFADEVTGTNDADSVARWILRDMGG